MSLKQLVDEEIKRPLSYEMLRDLVPPWVKVCTYDSLAKFKTLKSAMGDKQMLICLYQVHERMSKKLKNMAGHFIVINSRAKGQTNEYFSSSGWAPGKEIAATYSDPKILQRLLGNKFVYNSKPFERSGDSNTCWRWCLVRCILGHLTLKQFQRLFSQKFNPNDSDDIITILTLMITAQEDLKSKQN